MRRDSTFNLSFTVRHIKTHSRSDVLHVRLHQSDIHMHTYSILFDSNCGAIDFISIILITVNGGKESRFTQSGADLVIVHVYVPHHFCASSF